MDDDRGLTRRPALAIVASCLGTAFEWYDFFLYSAVASIFAKRFFGGIEPNIAYLFSLLAFSSGFAVRPLGSLIFGPLGDRWGRRNTFLVTMIIMGFATLSIGLLPTYHSIGIAAPILLVAARLIQGFAVGGEYGGAAVYIAEHAPEGRRGLHTSFIQVTCTFGLFLALAAVLGVRTLLGEDDFDAWGWRIPFLMSALLVPISVGIRLRLAESRVFQQLTLLDARSKSPLRDLFSTGRRSWKVVLAFALSSGMTVVFYNSQIYSGVFLEKILHVEGRTSNELLALALLLATPFFVFFGWLSDRVGRKWIIVTGCALAAVCYYPLFQMLAREANPALMSAGQRAPVTVAADPATCSNQLDLTGKTTKRTSCDIAKTTLTGAGVTYLNIDNSGSGAGTNVQIGGANIADAVAAPLRQAGVGAPPIAASFDSRIKAGLVKAGYPEQAPRDVKFLPILAILFAMIILVTMTYGPLAAILVELFPANIRYSGVSIPYNLSVGLLGGFVAPVAYSLIIATGNTFAGLWYPCLTTGFFGIVIACWVDDRRQLTRE